VMLGVERAGTTLEFLGQPATFSVEFRLKL
jgi:hypothetical protein